MLFTLIVLGVVALVAFVAVLFDLDPPSTSSSDWMMWGGD